MPHPTPFRIAGSFAFALALLTVGCSAQESLEEDLDRLAMGCTLSTNEDWPTVGEPMHVTVRVTRMGLPVQERLPVDFTVDDPTRARLAPVRTTLAEGRASTTLTPLGAGPVAITAEFDDLDSCELRLTIH